MTVLLVFIGIIFMIIGFLGCVIPAIPGPPLSYLGLLLLHFTDKYNVNTKYVKRYKKVVREPTTSVKG